MVTDPCQSESPVLYSNPPQLSQSLGGGGGVDFIMLNGHSMFHHHVLSCLLALSGSAAHSAHPRSFRLILASPSQVF